MPKKKNAGERALDAAIDQERQKNPNFDADMAEWNRKEARGDFDHLRGYTPEMLKAVQHERAVKAYNEALARGERPTPPFGVWTDAITGKIIPGPGE